MLHPLLFVVLLLGLVRADDIQPGPSFLSAYFRDGDLQPSLSSLYNFRSHHNQGCGPNPLLALVSEMPVWLQQSLSTASSTGDMMRTIRSDGTALREFLQFKRMLSRFKDCIKTGDGIRAKKSGRPLTPHIPSHGYKNMIRELLAHSS
jgi:hypothetical protein